MAYTHYSCSMLAKPHLWLLLLLIGCTGLVAFLPASPSGKIKEYVKQNANPIRSIDPSDLDFSDLAPIEEAIGNSRVVLLGEQDHGDAATFHAKTRLIKFLHEEMGFNVLAFESDFYALNHQQLEHEPEFVGQLFPSLYSIWSKCDENKPLFDYLKAEWKTDHKLVLTGFDARHGSLYTKTHYVDDLKKIINKVEHNLTSNQEEKFYSLLEELIQKEYKSKVNEADLNHFFSYIDVLDSAFQRASILHKAFWTQEPRNLRGCARNAWYKTLETHLGHDRDVQMAKNLTWLIQTAYPKEKIIVWAHNFHIAKEPGIYTPNVPPHLATLGGELQKLLGNEVSTYTMAFSSHHGEGGRLGWDVFPIPAPKGACLENWIHTADYEYAFIPFSKHTETKPSYFKMKGLSHRAVNGNWTEVFDGVFYIDEMYSCTR